MSIIFDIHRLVWSLTWNFCRDRGCL